MLVSMQIKGVSATDDHTGEQRQELLSQLQKNGREFSGAGIPVLFVKQPDNPVDPNAVAVMSGAVRFRSHSTIFSDSLAHYPGSSLELSRHHSRSRCNSTGTSSYQLLFFALWLAFTAPEAVVPSQGYLELQSTIHHS